MILMQQRIREMILCRDARDYQIFFLLIFFAVGLLSRDLGLRPMLVATAIVTAMVTQWLLDRLWPYVLYVKNRLFNADAEFKAFYPGSLRSALITALGLSLLMRSDSVSTMMIAAVLAVASKYLFRFNDKHFFNPSNFGIVMALLIFSDAWVTPGQWGQDTLYAVLFLSTGAMITGRVGRWDTTAAFLLAFALLEAARNVWLGWTWDVYQHQMLNGALLLFAFFMITDPRTIPDDRLSRICWSIAIAVITFVLLHVYFINGAVVWALFIMSPFAVLFDRWRLAPRFQWHKERASRFTAAQAR